MHKLAAFCLGALTASVTVYAVADAVGKVAEARATKVRAEEADRQRVIDAQSAPRRLRK